MIETLLIASLVMSIAIVAYLSIGPMPEGRRLLLRGLLELTIPLTLASGFFSSLQWWVRTRENTVTALTPIRDIELTIWTIRHSYIEHLIIPAWAQFCILFVLLLAGIVWPRFRAAHVLDCFKTTTRWMTRMQIAATLLTSFTLFGAVQATNARAAEVRLDREIGQIKRTYDSAFVAADEAFATVAAAQLVSDPRWTPAIKKLAEALENEKRANEEISEARAAVARDPNSGLRDFRMAMDDVPDRLTRQSITPRSRAAVRVHESWTETEGKQLRSEAFAIRREVTAELVGAAADVGREAIARRLIAEFFAGGTGEGLAAVVLDASVLYDFRHVVAEATNSFVERVVQHREAMKTAFAREQSRVRSDVARFTPNVARNAENAYAAQVSRSRDHLAEAERIRRNTLNEYRTGASAQQKLEEIKLIEYVSKNLDGWLEYQTLHLLQRLVGRSSDPPMGRVARIRALRKDLDFEPLILATLAEKEAKLGSWTPFSDALDERVQSLLRTERYSHPMLTVFYDDEVRKAWGQRKRFLVLLKIREGLTTIPEYEWSEWHTQFRAELAAGPLGAREREKEREFRSKEHPKSKVK